jgi:hypothetical protein
MKFITMKYWKKSITSLTTLFILLFCLLFENITAQDSIQEKKWNFLDEPYIMFPYMAGNVGIGENLLLPVAAKPTDIFNHLQIAAMLYLEARTDKWAITSDLVYMNLKQDVTTDRLINSGTVNAKQMIWEAAGLYRIFPFWEVGLGGRLNYLQTSVDLVINTHPEGTTKETDGRHHKTWYDPIIITRFSADIKDKWLFQLRADVGGFSVGSKLTWQLQGYAGYRFCKLFQLSVGYRYLSTDYSSGEEPKEFIFDVNEFGPAVRFGFNF